jgi:hypothetical protein
VTSHWRGFVSNPIENSVFQTGSVQVKEIDFMCLNYPRAVPGVPNDPALNGLTLFQISGAFGG